MLNRDQIAHDYAMQIIEKERYVSVSSTAFTAFELADAMIAEAEKRKCTERPDVLVGGWISVDDRLPENEEYVIVYRPDAHLEPARDRNTKICEYSDKYKTFLGSSHHVTHWQSLPLPLPPKGETE